MWDDWTKQQLGEIPRDRYFADRGEWFHAFQEHKLHASEQQYVHGCQWCEAEQRKGTKDGVQKS